MKHTSQLIKAYRKTIIKRWVIVACLLLVVAAVVGYAAGRYNFFSVAPVKVLRQTIKSKNILPLEEVKTGKIIEQQAEISYSIEQTRELIHQTNKKYNLPINQGITKQIIRFNSSVGADTDVPIYARVYKPASADGRKLPVFAFAPGTTGIDDHCAASLEQPAKSNWANYDSLLAAYATQGYVVVTIDYEGMRDLNRLHHYMVGEVEGKALLDSVRALKNLDSTKAVVDGNRIILGGYSQGGHAAYWADKLASNYAKELKVGGVVGFGPVSSVKETLADNTRGANINWFGPFVLTSYSDYYRRDYQVKNILLDKWANNLNADVAKNCIDTVIGYWGRRADQVYRPDFLQALKNDTLAQSGFASLYEDLEKNTIGLDKTKSRKLINQGAQDNVILPRQSQAFLNRLCASGNQSVVYRPYTATHYNTMTVSLTDTLSWMSDVLAERQSTSNCPG